MKLAEHVNVIRQLIEKAFRNRLGRMGITESSVLKLDIIPPEYHRDRKRIEGLLEVFIAETGTMIHAFEKLVDELSFTLFNRLAALKVMEAHKLHAEIVTRRSQYGDRSFSHIRWLDDHPESRNEDREDVVNFLEQMLSELSSDIQLFSLHLPYHLLPTTIELDDIIRAYNRVEVDDQIDSKIWESDDVLGWLYESYNNEKKANHKASKKKTEFHKVSIQSQVYTPRWVVKFLVDNSLGKLYLEMFPDSSIKEMYQIANVPKSRTREIKPLTEIKVIDPATGSGNFLLYAFDLFYDLYEDQIENYGASYDKTEIPYLIIQNNLHGVDLDDRAIQLAQLGIYIKAKRKLNTIKIEHFNIVSSDFFLPEFGEVEHLFENGKKLNPELEKIVIDLWGDLQKAYKFGSLIRLEEKFSSGLHELYSKLDQPQQRIDEQEFRESYDDFKRNSFVNLQKAVATNTKGKGLTFLNTKTQDAITFFQLLAQKYDVAVANPPYTDSSNFGPELKKFINSNYSNPFKFNSNLYATFLKRCYELSTNDGAIAMIHPRTFMFIKSFEDVRKFILEKTHINVFVDYSLSNLFGSIMVDPAFYILEKKSFNDQKAWFISLDQYTRTPNEKFKKDFCLQALCDYIGNIENKHNYSIFQSKLKIIKSWPFIYWISKEFRGNFKEKSAEKYLDFCTGSKSGDNPRFIRFWWEVDIKKISINYKIDKLKWTPHTKGGPFEKWFGNNWTVVNWENNAEEIKSLENSVIRNERMYFNEGITYSSAGSKGTSFRYLPTNYTLDAAGSGVYPTKQFSDIYYALAFLNSNIIRYIIDCLNPTVNTNPGDLSRIPFILPTEKIQEQISALSKTNVDIKKNLCAFQIYERNFKNSPLSHFPEVTMKERMMAFIILSVLTDCA